MAIEKSELYSSIWKSCDCDELRGGFEASTRELTDLAKAQLKKRWGRMTKVLSSQSRLEMIVDDVLMDMGTRDRFLSGRGKPRRIVAA